MNGYPALILASRSNARQMMLKNVGLDFEIAPAHVEEKRLITEWLTEDQDIKKITEKLAVAKAKTIAAQAPEALVIGSDQTLDCEGKILSKAQDETEAEEKLKFLRGKTHTLRSSVCVVQGENVLMQTTETAKLTMHDFSDDFLKIYMKKDPDALVSCVGAYKIEGDGAWLFSKITGNTFTIMGMPLLPLLTFLGQTYGFKP